MPSPKRLRSDLPALFGQDGRNRFLALLATEGKTRPQLASNILKIDRGQTWRIMEHFRNLGIVEKDVDGIARFASFRGSAALVALLQAMAGARIENGPPDEERTVHGVPLLFGGRNRTLILTLLSVLGPLSTTNIVKYAKVEFRAASHAVDHLIRERILAVSDDGSGTQLVQFDATSSWHGCLVNLCDKIASDVLDVSAVRAFREATAVARLGSNDSTTLPYLAERLMPFGLEQQSRALLEIARRDVVTRGHLANSLGWTEYAVRGATVSLERHSLIVKKVEGKGHHRRCWLALDPRHPLTPALRRFAQRLGGKQSWVGPAPAAFPPLGPMYRAGEIPACLIGEDNPNLLMVHILRLQSEREADLLKSVRPYGMPRRFARKWLHRLHQRGLIDYHRSGSTMTVSLKTDMPGFAEWKRLLEDACRFIETHRGAPNPKHMCRSLEKKTYV
jgi:hypothetical protein